MDELSKVMTRAFLKAQELQTELEAAYKHLEKKHNITSWVAYRKICEHYDYVRKLAFDLAVVEG